MRACVLPANFLLFIVMEGFHFEDLALHLTLQAFQMLLDCYLIERWETVLVRESRASNSPLTCSTLICCF